jgi:hypothetical protein
MLHSILTKRPRKVKRVRPFFIAHLVPRALLASEMVLLKAKMSLADGPVLRPDGPRWRRGRSAHAQSQLGFLVSRGICCLKPRD